MSRRSLFPPLLAASVALCGAVHAQFLDQRYVLTADERRDLSAGRDRLQKAIAALKEQSARTGQPTALQIPDAEIYFEAVDRNLRQNLFFAKASADQAQACLKEGEARAAALKDGKSPWERQTGFLTLGYRSAVDGSAQPYQAYVPASYRFEQAPPSRLDIFLHGRGGTLNELSFLTSTGWVNSYFGTPTPPNLALHPYGRANNGWRWAGEQDAFEALADMKRRFRVDEEQTTVRGFSMGGHGTWHIGLQHPGTWAVMAPGAGFTDTRVYQKISDQWPEWQMKLLHMYDPVDWALNGKNLPVLAYCGEEDPALGQHVQMVARLKEEGAPFKEYIGPKTPHRYEPAARTAILTEMAQQTRQPQSPEIHFVTYTLRWPDCKWVRLEGLEHHWDRTEVHARADGPGRVELTTKNVAAIQVTPPGKPTETVQVTIDGQKLAGLKASKGSVHLLRKNGKWSAGELKGLRKEPGLQGPIDDATFGPILAVTGTGTPWSPELDKWLGQEVQRFRDGWDEYFRADLPEKTDRTLTEADIRDKNLYLFGDPGSNRVLARLLPKLPLKWTEKSITIAGQTFSTRNHLPVLVFPNPENPKRYVVIDCGLTWGKDDWHGSNALQYSHLPDYAVLQFDPDQYNDDFRDHAVLAGFFNERWQAAP